MMEFFKHVSPWLLAPLIYMSWIAILMIAKKIAFSLFSRLACKTSTKIDDIFIDAANLPIQLCIYVSGGLFLQTVMPEFFHVSISKTLPLLFKGIAILAAAIFVERFLIGLVRTYSVKVEILKTSENVVRGLVRVVVYSLGLLVLLDNFGVSVTPIVASMGIGSLAVALALQPTLENMFAGIQIVTDKTVQEGNFIRLESGDEGYVETIGWRATWIRLPQNNMIVVPNKALVNSRVMNFHYPAPELVVVVTLGVHYQSDMDQVEKVTLEVAHDVMQTVEGGVRQFAPVLRFKSLGDFSVNFDVVLRAREVSHVGLVRHEFIKRLLKRYAQEGIIIPYPVQAVNYEQEGASKALDKG